jgi:hypothetical protein
MAYGGGGAATAIHAAIVRAIKASGVLVRVEPETFQKILDKNQDAVVIISTGGLFNRGMHYLTSYKGFAFYTKTSAELILPGNIEIISARQIWMPN